jgi:hypothetical protein
MSREARCAAHRITALCLLLLAACTTTIRQHPEFSSRVQAVRNIGFMPPAAAVTLVVFRGDNELLQDETRAIQDRLPGLLADQLKVRDFNVQNVKLDEEALAAHPELRFEASAVQQAFEQALGEMFASPTLFKSKALNYQRTLGPEINRFADFVDAEALVFARYSGFRKSGGEVTRDVLFTVLLAVATLGAVIPVPPPSTGGTLQVCVVDGATGDVLWANQMAAANYSGPPDLDSLVQKTLEPFRR